MMKNLYFLSVLCLFLCRVFSQNELHADSNQILSVLRLLHARSLDHRAHMQRLETLMKDIVAIGKGDEALQQSIIFLKKNLEVMITKLTELENKLSSVNLLASQNPQPSDSSVRESQLLLNMQNTLRNLDQNIQSLQNRIPSREFQTFSVDTLNSIIQNHMNRLEQNMYRKLENFADKQNRYTESSSGSSGSLILTGKDVTQLIQEAFNSGMNVYSSNVEHIFDRKLHNFESIIRTVCTQSQKFFPNSALELTAHKAGHLPESQIDNRPYSPVGIDIISPPNPKETIEVGKRLKISPTYLKNHPKDCVDILNLGMHKSGIYEAYVAHDKQSVPIYCDMDTDGGGWTVVLRRDNSQNPHISFDRPWSTYKNGFGDLNSEFWLGNKYIHALTTRMITTVRIEIIEKSGRFGFAEYVGFRVYGEHQKYLLHTGTFTKGNIADEFSSHNGTYFSTPEEDNDRHPGRNCAETFYGGWWYDNCLRVCFTGQHVLPLDSKAIQGIYWGFRFPGNANLRLRAAIMKIRPYNFRRIST